MNSESRQGASSSRSALFFEVPAQTLSRDSKPSEESSIMAILPIHILLQSSKRIVINTFGAPQQLRRRTHVLGLEVRREGVSLSRPILSVRDRSRSKTSHCAPWKNVK